MDLRCGLAVAAQHRERGRENYVGDLGWAADSCGAACWAVEAETTAAHDVAVQHHGRPRPFPIRSLPVAPSPSSPRPGARRPSSTLRQLGSSLAWPEGPREAALAPRPSGGFASASGILMKFVTLEEDKDILKEIHEGVCGNHAASRTLVGKAYSVGVYRQACSGIPLAVRIVGRDRLLWNSMVQGTQRFRQVRPASCVISCVVVCIALDVDDV